MADHWMHQPSITPRSNSYGAADAQAAAGLSIGRDSTSPSEQGNSKHANARIRRRNRLITSCLECRRRKLKCDKTAPCANCTRFKRDCLYLAPALDAQSQQKLAHIKEKMGALEKNLEREVASRTAKQHLSGAQAARGRTGEDDEDEGDDDDLVEDDEVLESTPLGAIDGVYDANGDDDLMDLGVQMGKMRISERIGGWIRPKLVDELNDTLDEVRGGDSRHAKSAQIYDSNRSVGRDHIRLQASPKSYIGPGPDYIAPTSSFFFPGTNMSTSLMAYLPSKIAADQLIAQYWLSVHLLAKAVHRPTFEAQYAQFWSNIATGSEPLPSIQAIMFATMFSAAVSMTEDQVVQRFRTSRAALIDTLRSGTEMALAKANFLRTTKVDVMQAFVIYLIPLVRAEISRAHSALVGTAIRLAECMGLHRDGALYNMSPIEVNVRRMVWTQLCFLDMRACEATGPRPQIRREDYDTKAPMNVDDAALLRPGPYNDDPNRWTDATLMRIRAEVTEARRANWFDVISLDKRKKSLTSVLVKIQKFRLSLESRYLPMLDDSIPFHVLSRHIIALGVNSLFIQVLHRYFLHITKRMPDRLLQILIECGLAQMENAIALETKPELAPWAWYKGAFNQYHSALLLMVEVYAYPMRKDAARIWKCLDFIFDIPPHLSPKQKAELVITDLRDRMEIFHQMRRVRATTQMEERAHGGPTGKPGGSGKDPSGGDYKPHVHGDPNASIPLSPNAFHSPPQHNAESSAGGSRHGSQTAHGPDTPMMADEIDWVSRSRQVDVSSWVT